MNKRHEEYMLGLADGVQDRAALIVSDQLPDIGSFLRGEAQRFHPDHAYIRGYNDGLAYSIAGYLEPDGTWIIPVLGD